KGDGEKILIIDDQAEQNEILEESLSKLGYKPHSVTSGEKGLEFHISIISLSYSKANRREYL
ncbi:MAG: response regulator, partial [Desulfobulbaceae bacterium]|nr:response regulator [Desulfobulbaceae bacterium]